MVLQTVLPTFFLFLAIGIGTYVMFTRFLGTIHDPREPPLLSGFIPYIGHVIGLMRSKFNYYVELRYFTFLSYVYT